MSRINGQREVLQTKEINRSDIVETAVSLPGEALPTIHLIVGLH